MRDGLGLHRGVDHHPLQVLGRDRAGLVRDGQALLNERHELLLAEPLAPARQRGAVEGQLVAEALLAAEELVIRVLDPARAQHLVGQVVHVLQDEEPGHQPRRQRRLARPWAHTAPKRRSRKAPVDLLRQPHQRMLHVDDLIERRPQQVLLTIVPRCDIVLLRPRKSAARESRIRRKPESQIARKRDQTAAFLQNQLLNQCGLTLSPKRI